jgi:Lsr2
MAQAVTVLLTDDLDGSEASETVKFALDGAHYEIDLSEQNAAGLRDAIRIYINAGRKASGVGGNKGKNAPKQKVGKSSDQLSAVRAWARDNGYAVSDRGRVPGDVKAAYEAAQLVNA